MNGDIIEYLIGTVQCVKQSTFNQIVDLRQSAMARCPGLSAHSLDHFMSQTGEDGRNFDGFLHSEQISFLLQICTDPKYATTRGAPGTLITFQEGLSGDDFGEVRQRLRDGGDFVARHGVAHLLVLLTRCIIESAADIEKFADAALLDLAERLDYRKELKNLANYKLAKKVTTECELMHRILLPMVDALGYMCGSHFPHELLGNNVIAWNNLHLQVRRLDQNVMEKKVRAKAQ
eukprot:gene46620-57089_t